MAITAHDLPKRRLLTFWLTVCSSRTERCFIIASWLLTRGGLFDATVATRLIGANSADDANRRDRIWFCFFPPHIGGEGGIGSLLGLWGGEALYRGHDRDPEIGPLLAKIGTPCLVEADVPIESLRRHSSLDMKIVRQYLKSRGLQTSEPVDHEDCATTAIPVTKIRRIIRLGDPEFETLTKCNTWRKRLEQAAPPALFSSIARVKTRSGT
jgi:hypothetical protein